MLHLVAAVVSWLGAAPVLRDAPRASSSRLAVAMSAGASSAELVGTEDFARSNPMSDRFDVIGFHHVELYCADATSAASRFCHALGMDLVARSDPTTGNPHCCSLVALSSDVRFVFTAPLPAPPDEDAGAAPPGFGRDVARAFVDAHGGLAVRAVCIQVADARAAYRACVDGGGASVLPPVELREAGTAEGVVAEVELYGDVVLRLVELDPSWRADHLPGYAAIPPPDGGRPPTYGIERVDHVVGNVYEMLPTVNRLKAMTGFHEFAEFTAEDVGTVDSGLNSMVLACNGENVLLPVNEPTYGTRRRSQIETYLVNHKGEGVQHIALFTAEIFGTVRAMRAAGARGGLEFMARPSANYYAELPSRMGDALSLEQLAQVEELGLLADRDDQGVLLQVFTRPAGDRPTLFVEIIQRIGCMVPPSAPTDDDQDAERDGEGEDGARAEPTQRGGCGGFGKGNFKELFKSVEDFERSLDGD